MAKLRASFLSLGLSLLLAVTSQAFAVSKGQAAPVGTMVICQGAHMVTVAIDADGQPVEVPHLCPDYALFVGDGAPAPLALRPVEGSRAAYLGLQTSDYVEERSAVYLGRAPPRF